DDAHAAAAELLLDHEVAERAPRRLLRRLGLPLLVAEQAVEREELAALRQDPRAQRLRVARGERRGVRRAAARVQLDELLDGLLHGRVRVRGAVARSSSGVARGF